MEVLPRLAAAFDLLPPNPKPIDGSNQETEELDNPCKIDDLLLACMPRAECQRSGSV